MQQVAVEADRLPGGQPDTCLLIDESGFVKKGKDSAGVARQWCGGLGKLDNCQVGVFAELCHGQRHIPIDGRLSPPKEWIEDRKRCRRVAVWLQDSRPTSDDRARPRLIGPLGPSALLTQKIPADRGDFPQAASLVSSRVLALAAVISAVTAMRPALVR